MTEAIIAILLLFGGAYGGSQYQKNKCNEELQEVMEVNNNRLDSVKVSLYAANSKLDSLKSLPAKVDTIVIRQKEIVEKTDTLILMSQDILLNTDTIKNELRKHIEITKE
ncbi:hypothetical protein [Marinilabilia salmonicolor]|uniref:Uncharacterized protein n=1 Tax=Marinilabilia salmonicolor TaxID=989 RepID=A0A368VG55_9BACT|nr:hypothetical protein [Marinilabilia salmonicolor]RCW38654.1 hypothetical protein DFO77_103124 [Marinilabilia salmonicolor]